MRAQHLDPVFTWLRAARLARAALALLWLAAGLLGAAAAALAATPLGSQFQVNTYTFADQMAPSVAASAGGGFVVVWNNDDYMGTDASGRSISGQRYDASGNPVGSEFQVNTYTPHDQEFPSVAADAEGNFVVVWQSYGSAGTDQDSYSVQAQRYDASGNPIGSEFQVNTYTTGQQRRARVAADEDGDFVVVWVSDGSAGGDTSNDSIQGQRYDASGNAVGSEFQVNTYTTGNQWLPWVAANADGNFVVVWRSEGSGGTDHDGYSVQARRYDAGGNAVGGEFQVNSYTTGSQSGAAVAANANGDFVVVWRSEGSAGTDASYTSVQGQRYDASGNAVGNEFQVNTYTTGGQSTPSVALQADGGFVVTWQSDGSAGGDTDLNSIQGQCYDASGIPVGSQFQVNTYTTSYQWGFPSVAVQANGDFVVTWFSEGSPGTDQSSYSVQGQRYTVQALRLPSLSPPGAIGLGLLLLGIAAAGLRGRLRGRA